MNVIADRLNATKHNQINVKYWMDNIHKYELPDVGKWQRTCKTYLKDRGEEEKHFGRRTQSPKEKKNQSLKKKVSTKKAQKKN